MKPEKKYLTRRIIACIIDYGLILVYTGVHFSLFGELNEEGGYTLRGLPALSVMAFWGVLTIGMEQVFSATIGNIITGIKPSSLEDDGSHKISFSQSIKRHLLDPIDLFFFGLVAFICISSTQKGQRLGDLWAKTKIVKA